MRLNHTKKRLKMYDSVVNGCRFCTVDNADIKSAIDKIREDAKQIITEIPTM